ncbi:hypothetical protein Mapa_012778 [Marchantia paleacea]|nr:hypothetical protein Mapa_012778 [Marchantia paleacea]
MVAATVSQSSEAWSQVPLSVMIGAIVVNARNVPVGSRLARFDIPFVTLLRNADQGVNGTSGLAAGSAARPRSSRGSTSPRALTADEDIRGAVSVLELVIFQLLERPMICSCLMILDSRSPFMASFVLDHPTVSNLSPSENLECFLNSVQSIRRQ